MNELQKTKAELDRVLNVLERARTLLQSIDSGRASRGSIKATILEYGGAHTAFTVTELLKEALPGRALSSVRSNLNHLVSDGLLVRRQLPSAKGKKREPAIYSIKRKVKPNGQ
jgi:hypothetical protein